ncbi:hypothetical protein AD931_04500, partial [Gluconobacter oxydans]
NNKKTKKSAKMALFSVVFFELPGLAFIHRLLGSQEPALWRLSPHRAFLGKVLSCSGTGTRAKLWGF